MFDLETEWSISFAGCGFLGIYYVGLAACLLERAPFLLKGAKRIYGASSGALTATVLLLGMPLAYCCKVLMEISEEATVRKLGPLHPSCRMRQIVEESLNRDLPADAHTRASGRLCVSLTRMSDGQNVLVSEFSTRQELIEALVCSCYVPIYFGLNPPTFRGVRYMDGAMSNNQPQYHLKETLTVAPFCGDCVICPRDDAYSLHTVRVFNVSYRVNLLNLCRIARVFFPPEPKAMAEICQNGYKDGLQFLKENDLLRPCSPSAGLPIPEEMDTASSGCCDDEDDALQSWTNEAEPSKNGHSWLDRRSVEHLPAGIKKVLCEACREKHSLYGQVADLLPVRMASYMLLPYTLPVQSAYSMAQRLVQCIPVVAEEVKWLLEVCGDLYRHTGNAKGLEDSGAPPPLWDETSALDRLAGQDGHPRPSSAPGTTQARCLATETTPPRFGNSVAVAAGKIASTPAAVNSWALSLQWIAEWMDPATFEPTL